MLELGMIHGRYQPFHIGHLDYLVQALRCARKLIVGITNPDPGYVREVGSDSHRHLADANPFSYYLRMRMIQNSILCDDELRARYRDVFVTPFPVNTPEYWKYYVPSDAVQIMRILDPWDQEKQNLFRSYGFQVAILESKRVTSGTEIRRDILSGETDWRTRVPLGALEVLEHWLRQESI